MKKMTLLLFLLVAGKLAFACDICGCGVGSYYIGLLPDFKQRFAGLRYQYKTMRSHLGPGGSTSYLTTDETYQAAELWGGWNIGKKFRLLGFVPLNFSERSNQGISKSKTGLGDIAVTGYYQVFSKMNTVAHSLWIGGGVKLPTGKYEPAERKENEDSPNNFQLGTASVDFTLNAMYDIRLMDVGLNTNISYKINTRNKYDYQYGNKFTANLLAYYKLRPLKELSISPNAGLLYETADKDTEQIKVDVSGGYTLMGTAGVELSFKQYAVGGNFQPVLSQELAGMKVKAGNRAMVHLTYLF
ncbi:transporter [Chitinophaga niabensis]|nr:transporter [Chitinophaga niabensis]